MLHSIFGIVDLMVPPRVRAGLDDKRREALLAQLVANCYSREPRADDHIVEGPVRGERSVVGDGRAMHTDER